MTDKQFWMKADQIAESRKSNEEKVRQLAALLKTAYDENLKIVIANQEDRQVYLNLDEEHPDSIGNRCMLCYTSKRKAQEDLYITSRRMEWGYAYTRDILNNFFHKAVSGQLIFNCHEEEWIIVIPKEILMEYIPGPYPIPDGFVDVPVNGYPVFLG